MHLTGQDIREMFLNNKDNGVAPSAFLVSEIGQNTKVELEITEDGLGYYYSVDIVELAKSNIEQDTLKEMKANGWQISKDRKKIIKNC